MNNHFPSAAEKIVADYLEKMKTHLMLDQIQKIFSHGRNKT